jgi:hypothetical protein
MRLVSWPSAAWDKTDTQPVSESDRGTQLVNSVPIFDAEFEHPGYKSATFFAKPIYTAAD